MEKLCRKFDIQHSFLTPYYSSANGLVEAFNKTIVKILKKTVVENKCDWDEKLQEALWAYRTTHHTATKAMSYSLVYGVEAVIPIEMQVASLRIVVHQSITDNENANIRLAELDLLDKKRLVAQQQLQLYQASISTALIERSSIAPSKEEIWCEDHISDISQLAKSLTEMRFAQRGKIDLSNSCCIL
ncbi:uncharacterized protein LOC131254901 [Magnolia sinica]|uniref:uncharacterized protein LOC131254901 n=1 Tax=Magnolia sinica TaxID=86752 RepID=UPI0026589959|nr:uncharacterized protein LOC131254901 [Magnolia sinica]